MASFIRAAIPVAVSLMVPVAGHAQSTLPAPPQLPPVGQAPSPAAPPPSGLQPPAREQGKAAPPPGPYMQIPVTAAAPVTDPSFPAFRKNLAGIVRRKDRAGLERLVGSTFFWLTEAGDQTEKDETPFESFTAAIELEDGDDSGWEFLAAAAADTTLQPFSERPGAYCAPAGPIFDYQTFGQLLATTGTKVSEWAYTLHPDVQVRASGSPNSAVVETIGRILVRTIQDVGPSGQGPGQGQGQGQGQKQEDANAVRVMTPSGRTGWIAYDDVWRLSFDQLCYMKEGDAWKIAGYLSGKE